MGKSAPPPPDYTGAAEKQSASGQTNVSAQTQANRPNQSNAFGGSVQWEQGPNGQWTQRQSFGGPLGDASSALQGQVAANAAAPFDNGSAARDQAISGAYNQATSRLNPEWDHRGEAQQAQLANQGLDPNSEAYRNASQQFGRDRNDAYGSAMNSAIAQGTAAQQATFNQNMQARMAPMQQLQGLQGFLSMPGFNAAGAAGPTNYLGAAQAQGDYAMQKWQQENQANADVFNGAAGLASKVPFFFL